MLVFSNGIIIYIYFYKLHFILVKGQSLVVDPGLVDGVLGGFAKTTWTFSKLVQSDAISNVRLFLGSASPPVEENLLYTGTQVLKSPLADKIFGDCIEATWKKPQYTVTIKNLSFSDKIMVTLAINSRINGSLTERTVVFKSVQIEVKGMDFL